MPFNKGDFTQQGVAGHVNAILRLNEKRLVNIDLTSDEDAAGCTIAGAVTDLLNNEVYPIGAGVSGNIEITENGENINVAPYATATVNVSGGGDSDLTTATLTVINNTVDITFTALTVVCTDYVDPDYPEDNYSRTEGSYLQVIPGNTETFKIPLYKGESLMKNETETGTISVSGDAVLAGTAIIVTGDCTITLT